jgi:hypothetical protein
MPENFDHEYMQSVIENIKKNLENIQQQPKENEEQKEYDVDSDSFSITLYFDNSESSKQILMSLAKKSLISNCKISDIVMGIIVENTIL